MKKFILNTALLATLMSATPAQAKVNILLGTGATFGKAPLKPFKRDKKEASDFVGFLVLQGLSFEIPFQVEHEFGNLVWGLNTHISTLFIYTFVTIGLFFGGQISKNQTTTCYMKGGINFVGAQITVDSKKVYVGVSPSIEFTWKQEGKRIVHALEIGPIIWLDSTKFVDHPFTIPGTTTNISPLQIKYKVMWKLN